jgi:hypothetical protein
MRYVPMFVQYSHKRHPYLDAQFLHPQQSINVQLTGRNYLLAPFFFTCRRGLTGAMVSSLMRFLDHIWRRTTFGRTPLGEWSARRRDLYLTTNNTHKRKTSMPSVGFEPTISTGERPQTYAFDRADTGIGYQRLYKRKFGELSRWSTIRNININWLI